MRARLGPMFTFAELEAAEAVVRQHVPPTLQGMDAPLLAQILADQTPPP